APLDLSIKRAAEKLFQRPLLNGYGMTECASTICQVRCYESIESGSVGRPLPGLEVRMVDAEGKRIAVGEVGELHVRGPNIMLGYFRNPIATSGAIDD